jgi:hypothetical protein
VNSDLTLWGLPLIWWGRIGKLLSFLAGGTIILDIIGPERISDWSRTRLRVAPKTAAGARTAFTVLIGLVVASTFPAGTTWLNYSLGLIVAGAAGYLLAPLGAVLANGIGRGVLWVFRAGAVIQVVRIVAAILLVVGFLLDMLAS